MAKTYQQLQAELAALQKQVDSARKREVQQIVRQIKDAVALFGLTAADLGLDGAAEKARPAKQKLTIKAAKKVGAKKARSAAGKAPGKKKAGKGATASGFADAAGNTWSGRGPRPGWFKDALAAGKTPDELRVG